MSSPLDTLREGARALGLALDAAQLGQLIDFLALLGKWNKVYNLTAVRDPGQMLTHHVLDSLAAAPGLQRHWAAATASAAPHCPCPEGEGARPARLLDVGSGGGLPGVVFAVCCHWLQVHCVDAVAKKAAFIRQAAGALGLFNLHALHARVETLSEPFDVVCCRAFASLADFTASTRRALAPGGAWLALKGKYPQDEIAAMPAPVRVFHVERLHVPGLAAERCLIWLQPAPAAIP